VSLLLLLVSPLLTYIPSLLQWQNAEVVSASLDKYVELLEDLRDGELPSPEEIQSLHDEMIENTEAMESILLCTSHQVRCISPCTSATFLADGNSWSSTGSNRGRHPQCQQTQHGSTDDQPDGIRTDPSYRRSQANL